MVTIVFTYGTEGMPFVGGWTEITALTPKMCYEIFKELHPNPRDTDTLNCAFTYLLEEFKKTGMGDNGNFGNYCHERYTLIQEV